MSYIDQSRIIYETIENTDFSNPLSKKNNGLTFFKNLNELSAYKELKRDYLKESQELMSEKIEFAALGSEIISNIKGISHLEDATTKHMLFFLFWIWHNKFDLPRDILKLITKPIFIGILGYMLLDYYTDQSKYGKETMFLGFNLIRIAEQVYCEVFENINTMQIFNEHAAKYSQIEFTEKSNMWKSCPFSWNDSWELGYKASPSFSIYEILFTHFNLGKEKIKDLLDGMVYMTAGIQLMDDLSDTKEDLQNGIETLVMSGFYSKHGTQSEVSQNKIDEFLTEDKILKIYDTSQSLFSKASNLFEKHNDEILILYNEIQLYRSNNIFEIVEL